MDKFIGIDISKQTFDVSYSKVKQEVFSNDLKGFKRLLKKIDKSYGILMEASGPYYLELATFFHEQGFSVFVENPLKIKRYAQSKLRRAKTDKKDAEIIRDYAETMRKDLRQWEPESEAIINLKQLFTYKELLVKQINQMSNQLGSFTDSGHVFKDVKKSLESSLRKLKNEKNKVESKMREIVKEEYKETLELLCSIPGISLKTATILIAVTDNFTKFIHYKQLIAFVGLSPRIYTSGTSVKGAGHICKLGSPQVRKMLYMCSLSAARYNKACKELNLRLIDKGKQMRVRRIAIANKLLKQAFAIVKSGEKYNKNYQPEVWF